MMRYNELVSQTSVPHSLLENPKQSLPGDLQTLTGHLVIECIRYMMRTCCVDKATDAFTRYLIEPHQISTEWSTQCPTAWDKDMSWCFRLCSNLNPTTEAELEVSWEDRVLQRLMKGIILSMDIPSWPKILNLGGRVVLWNPMGPLCLQLLLSGAAEAEEEEAKSSPPPYTPEDLREMEKICAEVLDLSGMAMVGTVVLWLKARILVVDILRESILDIVAEAVGTRCSDTDWLDQVNDLLGITTERLHAYQELLNWLIGSLITEGDEDQEDQGLPEEM